MTGQTPNAVASEPLIGLAALMRLAYAAQPMQPVLDQLVARTTSDPQDAAAWMDISTVLMLSGQKQQALDLQSHALSLSRIYRRLPEESGDSLRVLALMTPGDLMANTPLDFLLEGSGFDLWMAFVDAEGEIPLDLPQHDVAVVAVGESPTTGPTLEGLGRALREWPRPVLNRRTDRVAALTRDGVAAAFAQSRHVLAPAVRRAPRPALGAVAAAIGFPVIIRPLGSHAGQGLEKLDDAEAVEAYLARMPESEFFVSPFIDYASEDGLFRKQRIAFVNGRAFISHMAVSEHWMVHYLSARMETEAVRREEEDLFMKDFRTAFCQRQEHAFAELNAAFALDYFGIDCAETRDGRLLLFEADVAMIVHNLDPDPPFGYKKPHMAELFRAYQAGLGEQARLAPPSSLTP